MALRIVFGSRCRDDRIALDLSQQQLADAVGIHRGHLANIEAGRVNVSADLMDRIAETMGQRLELTIRSPTFVAARPLHDTVHAWCTGYVGRRLLGVGWLTAREVDVSSGTVRGWVDLPAFDRTTRTLVIIEIKTRLDDLGGVERQLGWYERQALAAARRLGWNPARVVTWLLILASVEVDQQVLAARDAVDLAFPGRATGMFATLAGSSPTADRSIAMIDPVRRRAKWLIATRLDGRRSPAPYRTYADAVQRISARRRGR